MHVTPSDFQLPFILFIKRPVRSASYRLKQIWNVPVCDVNGILHTLRTGNPHIFNKIDARHAIRPSIITATLHKFTNFNPINNVFFGTTSPPPCSYFVRTSAPHVQFSCLHPSFFKRTPNFIHHPWHHTFAKLSSWR